MRRPSAKLLCIVLSISLLPSCRSFRPAPSEPHRLEQRIVPGDEVRVLTHDGRRLEFRVTAVTKDGLVGRTTSPPPFDGQHVTVAYSEISRIEKSEFDGGRTAGLVAVILIVATAIAGIVLVSMMDNALAD